MNRIDQIRQWASEGKSLSWVGERLGISKQRVHFIAEENEIKFSGKITGRPPRKSLTASIEGA